MYKDRTPLTKIIDEMVSIGKTEDIFPTTRCCFALEEYVDEQRKECQKKLEAAEAKLNRVKEYCETHSNLIGGAMLDEILEIIGGEEWIMQQQ